MSSKYAIDEDQQSNAYSNDGEDYSNDNSNNNNHDDDEEYYPDDDGTWSEQEEEEEHSDENSDDAALLDDMLREEQEILDDQSSTQSYTNENSSSTATKKGPHAPKGPPPGWKPTSTQKPNICRRGCSTCKQCCNWCSRCDTIHHPYPATSNRCCDRCSWTVTQCGSGPMRFLMWPILIPLLLRIFADEYSCPYQPGCPYNSSDPSTYDKCAGGHVK